MSRPGDEFIDSDSDSNTQQEGNENGLNRFPSIGVLLPFWRFGLRWRQGISAFSQDTGPEAEVHPKEGLAWITRLMT